MSSTDSDPLAAMAWKRTLYVMFIAQMFSMIGFSSIFPFLPLYVKSLGAATSLSVELLSGLVFSAQAFTMMIVSPFWGALADRMGRKIMVERAMFGGAVLLGLMAFARCAEDLVLLRGLQGMITGIMGAANALVAATVPRQRAGYAMGLMQVGMGLGLGLGPIIGGTVADAFGYRSAFFVTSFLLAAAGIVVFFGVNENFTPPKNTGKKRWGIFEELGRILATPGIFMGFCLRFLNQAGRMIFVPILPMFILQLLDDTSRVNGYTGLSMGIMSGATALFAVLLGRLGDRVGHRKILIACSLSCCCIFTFHLMVRDVGLLMVLQGLAGMALGGIIPGVSALLAQYTKAGDEGGTYGLDTSITSGARAAGPMAGVGVAIWLGPRAVFGAGALLYLSAALLALWVLPRIKPPGSEGG